jgi:hypothetical protein
MSDTESENEFDEDYLNKSQMRRRLPNQGVTILRFFNDFYENEFYDITDRYTSWKNILNRLRRSFRDIRNFSLFIKLKESNTIGYDLETLASRYPNASIPYHCLSRVYVSTRIFNSTKDEFIEAIARPDIWKGYFGENIDEIYSFQRFTSDGNELIQRKIFEYEQKWFNNMSILTKR